MIKWQNSFKLTVIGFLVFLLVLTYWGSYSVDKGININFEQKQDLKFKNDALWFDDDSVNTIYVKNQIADSMLNLSPTWFINVLDSIEVNKTVTAVNEMYLFEAISKNLQSTKYIGDTAVSIDFDSLKCISELSNLFWAYSQSESKHSVFLLSVSDLMTAKIAATLEYYGNKDFNVTNSKKFYFLEQYCLSRQYIVNIRVPKIKKLLYHISDNKWSHILEAFIYQTSSVFKFTVVILGVLFLYCFQFTIRVLYSQFNSKRNDLNK
jgi:hypothetical protein